MAFHPRRSKPLLISSLAAALLFARWLPQLVMDSGKEAVTIIEVIDPLTVHNVKTDLLKTSIGHPLLGDGVVPGGLALAHRFGETPIPSSGGRLTERDRAASGPPLLRSGL